MRIAITEEFVKYMFFSVVFVASLSRWRTTGSWDVAGSEAKQEYQRERSEMGMPQEGFKLPAVSCQFEGISLQYGRNS